MGDDINAIAAYDKDVYAIANNDTFVTIKDSEVTCYEKKTEDIISDLNSIYISGNGTRYYGTLGHSIVKIYGNGSTDVISTGNLSGINKMIYDGTKIWVLADNGVAYIGTDGRINLVSGLCITVYQAQQNYPKAVKSDSEGIAVMLVPEGEDKVIMQPGMARTQKVLMHFHAADEKILEILCTSICAFARAFAVHFAARGLCSL